MKAVKQAKTDAIKEDEYFFSDDELDELLQNAQKKRAEHAAGKKK